MEAYSEAFEKLNGVHSLSDVLQVCQYFATLSQYSRNQSAQSDARFEYRGKAVAERIWWEAERDTWLLLLRIHKIFALEEANSNQGPEPKVILEWLECTFDPREAASSIPISEHHRLKSNTVDRSIPDSEASAIRVSQTVYFFVRSGQHKNAIEFCKQQNEAWRGASLREALVTKERKQAKRHALWKESCFQLARHGSSNTYERALYATLCGDLEIALSVCFTWRDILWCFLKCKENSQSEELLQLRETRTKLMRMNIPAIVRETKERGGSLEIPIMQKFADLQMSLLLGQTHQIDIILQSMLEDARNTKSGDELSFDVLRFVTHFQAIIGRLAKDRKREGFDTLLTAYVDALRAKQMAILAPPYISQLDTPLQAEIFSRFLLGDAIDKSNELRPYNLTVVKDSSEFSKRSELIKAAERNHLDIGAILYKMLETILETHEVEPGSTTDVDQLPQRTEREDMLVNMFIWYANQGSHKDGLYWGTSIVRRFLAAGKPFPIVELVKEFSQKVISADMLKADQGRTGDDADNIVLYVREWKGYLKFYEAFSAYQTWLKEDKQPSDDTEEYTSAMKNATKQAESALQGTLSNSWLLDAYDADGVDLQDVQRTYELQTIREIWVPEMIVWLHRILYNTRTIMKENLDKSLSIAELAVSEKDGIYAEVQKAKKADVILDLLRLSFLAKLKVQDVDRLQ
ncbi:hypothetical protein BZG36_04137 [Bifiguratus adelaidae]|uniref:Nuclear pore complex protein n=1 Tax=Bifiguratus adelaidae TaxID=1938954 RepID=A0A261XVZ5_9FUNG|nr:hypothetical protein BZG36_04137 [Bifiguratus adelaidae]